MSTNNNTISLWSYRQGTRPGWLLSLLLLVQVGLVCSSPINLFYCPEKTDDENGETFFKYTFKWQQTRAIETPQNPYIWRILIGDHDSAGFIREMPPEATALEDLRPMDDLPFEFGYLQEVSTQEHGGWVMDYDLGFKQMMTGKWLFEQEKEAMPARDFEKDYEVEEKAPEKVEGQVGTRRVMEEPREYNAEEEKVAIQPPPPVKQPPPLARQPPPLNDAIVADLEAFPVRAGPRGTIGWYPRGIGYSVTWTGRAEKLVEDGTLYWTFLEGNLPNVGDYIQAIMDCSDHQDLLWHTKDKTLGLTESDLYIEMSHLINDDTNELQELQYNNVTKELSLTNSDATVDLSHMDKPPQELTWNNQTMELGLSGDPNGKTINLSKLAEQNSLSFNPDDHTLAIAGSGNNVDLSSIRIIALQASIDNVNGKGDDDRRHLVSDEMDDLWVGKEMDRAGSTFRGHGGVTTTRPQEQTRRLKKSKGVTYGGDAVSGWTILYSGLLVGLSVTADYKVREGRFEVRVVECSDMENTTRLGQPQDVLSLDDGTRRGESHTFTNPIPVKAGDILCFEVTRSGKEVKSEEKDNPASLVLLLEQT